MKRREFIHLGAMTSVGVLLTSTLVRSLAWAGPAKAKGGASIKKDQILKEGQPASIANYCENADKKPNKFCPDAKGKCAQCMFYNKDNSETTFQGTKYAHCQLLTDPKKPQFVAAVGSCATFVKDPSKPA